MVLIHNYPSGNLTPSSADLNITKKSVMHVNLWILIH
ncbi:MAG TPA: hypothetical protein DEP71_12060 [Porphyromonadaceae bacterium]|nr:hypothetical protein [Porphyromonadaceae bacterium]HCB90005.1 hypothetical protein [Porphyromonadaceae bacterium]